MSENKETQDPETEEKTPAHSPSEEETEVPKTIWERYVSAVKLYEDPSLAAEEANAASYGLAMIGLPILAYVFDWFGIWGIVGSAVAAPTIIGLINTGLTSINSWFARSETGVILSNFLPTIALGLGLSFYFEPRWVGIVFGIGLGASILVTQLRMRKEQKQTFDHLRLGRWLINELKTQTETQLHPKVKATLETSFESREILLETLNNTLQNDAVISSVSTLSAVDIGLAEMLDRAVPLSLLLKRKDGDDTVNPADVEQASAFFTSLKDQIEQVVQTTLAYAGTRDAESLARLREQAHDLEQARSVERELAGH